MALDIKQVLDIAHSDGSIKDVVRDRLDHFIIKDALLVEGLENYVKHNKKIFILTNSDFFYTKLLLDYAISPFLKNHSSWMDLFEFTITLSEKPRFFYDTLSFLKIDPKTGTMTNADTIEKGGVYQGGCADDLTHKLSLAPEEILYIGDHIYGDIVRLKKDCAWRTALVVEELGEEIDSIKKAQPIVDKIDGLMDEKIPLETKIDNLISNQIIEGHRDSSSEINGLLKKISQIDSQISPLIKQKRSAFNPHWGEVFRAGAEESYFAHQVERFACIYMSKLPDLLLQSPRTYYRSHKQVLAHEL